MQIVLWLLPLVVFGLAAYLGLGKLGEMPQHAVHDRPKGRIPDGPVDEAFLAEARIPVAAHGYDRGQVDGVLRRIADGEGVEPGRCCSTSSAGATTCRSWTTFSTVPSRLRRGPRSDSFDRTARLLGPIRNNGGHTSSAHTE
ncbi:hypothetical protein [Tessaracoccus defluvii]|uniref:DivIVA domain-containing protein n=1 Tax=Tessaracoccus defluvii TaxID=1285901 RepID=A0A7H0HA23_9ACTN|nr:hypothetical protein [Tessaracoccus defluvii]QNP57389.1 hypothetical protein H9L22_09280 [Tessaracoccus defluvii]